MLSKHVYRLLAVLSILSILLAGAAAPASAAPWRDKVDPWVLQTASAGETEFLVFLTSQADLSAANALPTKSQKGWYVYQTLTSLAERTQAPLIAELEKLGVQYRPYWVANMIWVKAGLNDYPATGKSTGCGTLILQSPCGVGCSGCGEFSRLY